MPTTGGGGREAPAGAVPRGGWVAPGPAPFDGSGTPVSVAGGRRQGSFLWTFSEVAGPGVASAIQGPSPLGSTIPASSQV